MRTGAGLSGAGLSGFGIVGIAIDDFCGGAKGVGTKVFLGFV